MCLCAENVDVSKDSCTYMKLNPLQLISTSDCNQRRGFLCTHSMQQLPSHCFNSFLPSFLSVFLSSALLFITTEWSLFLVSFHIICKMLFVKSAILFFFFNKDLWSSSNTKVIDTFHSQYSYKHPEWNFMLVLFVIYFMFSLQKAIESSHANRPRKWIETLWISSFQSKMKVMNRSHKTEFESASLSFSTSQIHFDVRAEKGCRCHGSAS